MRCFSLRYLELFVLAILLAFLLIGCNAALMPGKTSRSTLAVNLTALVSPTTFDSSPTVIPSPTAEIYTQTAVPTDTLAPSPTSTITATPSVTQTLAPTETMTSTATLIVLQDLAAQAGETVENSIRIFFIKENTGGPICGDSLVWINTDIPRTNNIAKNVSAALTRLFSYRSKYVGDLYNPAYVVQAKVKKVSLSPEGLLYIQLAGSLKERTKDDCENIRLREQIWATFRQFKGYSRYVIYLNSALLGDLINTDR